MIYEGHPLDEHGRPLFMCPRCENEEVEEGDFCKVCGVPVINKCTNQDVWDGEVRWECGTVAVGNARFCTKCGHKTTYYENNILKDWKSEKEEKEFELAGMPF